MTFCTYDNSGRRAYLGLTYGAVIRPLPNPPRLRRPLPAEAQAVSRCKIRHASDQPDGAARQLKNVKAFMLRGHNMAEGDAQPSCPPPTGTHTSSEPSRSRTASHLVSHL